MRPRQHKIPRPPRQVGSKASQAEGVHARWQPRVDGPQHLQAGGGQAGSKEDSTACNVANVWGGATTSGTHPASLQCSAAARPGRQVGRPGAAHLAPRAPGHSLRIGPCPQAPPAGDVWIPHRPPAQWRAGGGRWHQRRCGQLCGGRQASCWRWGCVQSHVLASADWLQADIYLSMPQHTS